MFPQNMRAMERTHKQAEHKQKGINKNKNIYQRRQETKSQEANEKR